MIYMIIIWFEGQTASLGISPTPQSSTTSLPTFDNHARRLCTRKSTFHLQIQINKTRAVHSPGIDALGFEFTNAQLTPALGAAKHPKVRTPMTPELGQFHFQPKSSHFDTGGYFRLVVKRAFMFPILVKPRSLSLFELISKAFQLCLHYAESIQ